MKFCPQCGQSLVVAVIDRRERDHCPTCGFIHFRNPPPAVIVLVHDGTGRVLLTRSPHFPPGSYGLVAGFVEWGETAEEAARREVQEEAGLQVELEHCAGTFLSRKGELMIAFVARAHNGAVAAAGDDVQELRWAHPSEAPVRPGSIAESLVHRYLGAAGLVVKPLGEKS
ncbi:MAG: NUDIX hydrolase [Armatimonadetes bacterium]|nr:NUDIX hydrolase [Armatimonadota bacterium]